MTVRADRSELLRRGWIVRPDSKLGRFRARCAQALAIRCRLAQAVAGTDASVWGDERITLEGAKPKAAGISLLGGSCFALFAKHLPGARPSPR